ncbi:MAG: MgtC/SapB family protein [Victivallales bacterium]|nr:MgtC/SapB family protein [Victivallales bacterium]
MNPETLTNLACQDPVVRMLGDWCSSLCTSAVILRMSLSFFYAAIIGYERANKRHSAGLRTFILVALGSCVAMLVDQFIASKGAKVTIPLSAATVIGIAFISSYSILYSARGQIKGLTTAMGLWSTALVGIANGAGFYSVALFAFLAQVFCLSFLPPLETYLKDHSNHFEIHLELNDNRKLPDFITTIRRLGLVIDDIEANNAYVNSGLSVFTISLTVASPELKKYKQHSEIIEALSSVDYISHIEEIH